MKGKRFSQEKIVGILKDAECKVGTIGGLCRKHGISEQTFYRWHNTLGGISVSEARRLTLLFGSPCPAFAAFSQVHAALTRLT